MSDDDLDTLDVAGAADYLKMGEDTVRRKARTGEIPGAKIGRRWVFLKGDLAAAIGGLTHLVIQAERLKKLPCSILDWRPKS